MQYLHQLSLEKLENCVANFNITDSDIIHKLLIFRITCDAYHYIPAKDIVFLSSCLWYPNNSSAKEAAQYYNFHTASNDHTDENHIAVVGEIFFYNTEEYYLVVQLNRAKLSKLWKEETDALIKVLKKVLDNPQKFDGLVFKDFVNELFHSLCQQEIDFVDLITKISNMRYESSECTGKILLAAKEKINNLDIAFKKPTKFSELKKTRKLLEITHINLMLVTDGNLVYGYISSSKESRQNFYSIHIRKASHWSLYRSTSSLLEYSKGGFTSDVQVQKKFEKIFCTIFSTKDFLNPWIILKNVLCQNHGTMLVFTDNAEKESIRLSLSNILIDAEPAISPAIVSDLTRIDGAVIMDVWGQVYAIGTILDGTFDAKSTMDISRGARYNSAIRYSAQHDKCLIIVISEDGDIDYITSGNKID